MVFTKADAADPTQAVNQDRLTSNVWLTRGSTRGLYNIAREAFFSHTVSPADTEWASGTTANYASLTYTDWETWARSVGDPPAIPGVNAVLHLKTDDIYLDIKFLSWSVRSGGFSYERSTSGASPINGTCGSANGGTFTTAPTTNLCSAGTATAVSGSGPWTWSCTGSNGGTTASCSANFGTPSSGTGGVMTVFGTRGTVTPTAPMYGSFALANTSVMYIAVLGQTLKTLGFTQNPLDLPNVRVYDASGRDVLLNASGGVTVSGCPSSAAVANYYATIRGQALDANDTCVSATLAAGVYTFTINPNTSSASGELLFEVTVNPTPPLGGVLTVFGTRGTVTPTAPMYGSFVLANTSVMYIAVLGQTLKTLGFTENPLDLPNVRVYDASGRDVLLNAGGGVTVSGCPSSAAVANYYATIRGQALNANDTCVSATLGAGVYTFTINPNTSSASGELLFEVTVNP